MKNKLLDLNNHLFAQLERLSDEEISSDDLAKEITRTDAVVKVAGQIIGTTNVALQAARLVADYGGNYRNIVPNYEDIVPVVEGRKDINNDQPALAAPPKGRKV